MSNPLYVRHILNSLIVLFLPLFSSLVKKVDTMYRGKSYTGADLPSKTLCLTYDDGPGNDTLEIAKFLAQQDIMATFFVVGKHAANKTEILNNVSALGHLIGNHTYEHPDMPYYLSRDGDIINQVLRTDAIIKKYAVNQTIFFRSPYGKWSVECANELNLNLLTSFNHLGPVHWDVGGIDCFLWKQGKTVDEAVEIYLQDIAKANKGIVVMHDEIADMEYLKKNNQTLDLTRKLIPLLKKQGYQFVRLDEIASIKNDVTEKFRFVLKASGNKYVCLSSKGDDTIMIERTANSNLKEVGIQDMGSGKFALLASNEQFFSVDSNDGCVLRAIATEVGEHESFDLVPIGANRLVLRAYNGNYLRKENDGRLVAAAPFLRGAEIFNFASLGLLTRKSTSTLQKLKQVFRRALFIKSKILQKVFQ